MSVNIAQPLSSTAEYPARNEDVIGRVSPVSWAGDVQPLMSGDWEDLCADNGLKWSSQLVVTSASF